MAFSNLRGEGNLEDQVARLAGELLSLKKSLSKRGASAYDDTLETASDIYSDMRERFTDALPIMRRRAHAVERVAKDNPAAAAAVGLVVVGLLVTLLLRSGGSSAPAAKPNRRSKR